jgi:hypothetical protein
VLLLQSKWFEVQFVPVFEMHLKLRRGPAVQILLLHVGAAVTDVAARSDSADRYGL